VFFSPSGKRRPEKKNNNPKGKNSIFQLMDEGRIVAFGRDQYQYQYQEQELEKTRTGTREWE